MILDLVLEAKGFRFSVSGVPGLRVQGFVAAGDLLATRPALASQVALITPDALKRGNPLEKPEWGYIGITEKKMETTI